MSRRSKRSKEPQVEQEGAVVSTGEVTQPVDAPTEKPVVREKLLPSPKRLGFYKTNPDAQLPKYAHPGDAGMDVFALADTILRPGVPTLVKTGLIAEIPDGYEIQVRPRSGLALKDGITVWNSPGTVDSKYRGEIGVILMWFPAMTVPNTSPRLISATDSTPSAKMIKKGDRIAQFVLAPVTAAEVYEVQEVSSTERGAGGFGSTGK